MSNKAYFIFTVIFTFRVTSDSEELLKNENSDNEGKNSV